MKRKVENRPEEILQIALLGHLRVRAMPGAFWFHVPNGQNLPVHIKVLRKRMGVVAGVPDMIFLYRGQIFGLELKAKGRKRSQEQIDTMNAMEVAGARTAVADTLDVAIVTLEHWGLLRRDRNKSGISEGQQMGEYA